MKASRRVAPFHLRWCVTGLALGVLLTATQAHGAGDKQAKVRTVAFAAAGIASTLDTPFGVGFEVGHLGALIISEFCDACPADSNFTISVIPAHLSLDATIPGAPPVLNTTANQALQSFLDSTSLFLCSRVEFQSIFECYSGGRC